MSRNILPQEGRAGTVTILVDGTEMVVRAGIPLAQSLSAVSPVLRNSPKQRDPRGMFCGMGLCFECMVEVDGIRRRACLTQVSGGMVVRTLRDGDER